MGRRGPCPIAFPRGNPGLSARRPTGAGGNLFRTCPQEEELFSQEGFVAHSGEFFDDRSQQAEVGVGVLVARPRGEEQGLGKDCSDVFVDRNGVKSPISGGSPRPEEWVRS